MADNTIMQTLYSKEWVIAYEQKMSLLRGTVTTEGEVKGNQFVFSIESTADIAVTRGANGNIPFAADNQSSATCTLTEYHHLARKNNFNIMSSAPNQRLSMQRRGVTSINNKTDQIILTQFATTTYSANTDYGGTPFAGLLVNHCLDACAILDVASVPLEDRYGVLTPKAMAWLMKASQFTSSDWVGNDMPYSEKRKPWRFWNNVKWMVHPTLPGVGTSTASCFIYHKAAVGHGLNMGEMQTKIGTNDEQDYSYARTSAYQGAKMLQTGGVIKMVHDDTIAV